FVFDLDFGAAVLAEQHAVAGLHIQRNEFALLALAGADGDYFALLGLLFCTVRDNDSTLDGFLFFNALHDYTVVERRQIDCHRRKTSIGQVSGFLPEAGRAVKRSAAVSTPHRRVLI